MESLIENFRQKLARTSLKFVRAKMSILDIDTKLIGIKGARGVGKTTMLLQYIKKNFGNDLNSVLYVSLDNLWFSENKLNDLISNFSKRGGKFLFIDEAHKYEKWAIVLKNTYDDFADLKVVFTGSSLLEIINARADLSRRADIFELQGLSFREFLNLQFGMKFDILSLDDILKHHEEISLDVVNQLKPIKHFEEYLKYGYYPFYREHLGLYFSRLEEVINLIIEIELPQLRNVNIANVAKLKQLLMVIAQSAPFIPNITKISERIGIKRDTLINYLQYLHEADLIFNAFKDVKGITSLQKPDKIFLENTNLMFALSGNTTDTGNVRETFFINQLKETHLVELSNQTDFLIDGKYSFQVGGKNKGKKQLGNIKNAFVAADNIEYGFENKIPLWLFGFMY
ncbi:MAG: AAA family ATPase [Candidatus Kapaibacterium sp.]